MKWENVQKVKGKYRLNDTDKSWVQLLSVQTLYSMAANHMISVKKNAADHRIQCHVFGLSKAWIAVASAPESATDFTSQYPPYHRVMADTNYSSQRSAQILPGSSSPTCWLHTPGLSSCAITHYLMRLWTLRQHEVFPLSCFCSSHLPRLIVYFVYLVIDFASWPLSLPLLICLLIPWTVPVSWLQLPLFSLDLLADITCGSLKELFAAFASRSTRVPDIS